MQGGGVQAICKISKQKLIFSLDGFPKQKGGGVCQGRYFSFYLTILLLNVEDKKNVADKKIRVREGEGGNVDNIFVF